MVLKEWFEKAGQKKKTCIFLYTILFALTAAVAFSYFYLNGKTFISNVDGIYQYYKALIYYRRYLRQILSDLFVNHVFEIPQWDFHMGEGSDILSAMYHTIGDPIAVFAVFVPERYMYLFYDLTIVLRIYLSGLCFLWLCFYTEKGNLHSRLAGAIVYDFCYWMILSQSKDIYFLNPTICMPLVILGVEMIIKERKPLVFVLGVFYSGISNFYFFYMIVILTVLYVIVRSLVLYGLNIRKTVSLVLYIAFYAVIGTALSAITALPVGYALLSNNRLSVDYGIHAFYPIIYYERMLNVFFSKDDPYWLCMGYASPCLLSLALSLKQFKKDKLLFFLNLITIIMICLPYAGKVLNGFSYVSNRWCFAISLLVAFTFTAKWDEFRKNKVFLLTVIFLVFGWAVAFPMSREVRIFVPICICLFFYAIVVMDGDIALFGFDLKQWILLGLVVLSVLYNADYVYSYRGRQRTNVVVTREYARDVMLNQEAYVVSEYIDDDDFFRYSGSDLTHNVAILNGTYTTSYYFSIANPYVSSYRFKLGINEYLSYMYKEYDARALLHTLASVRYYVTPQGFEGQIPYGFRYQETKDGFDIYRNENDLPFGYTMDKAVSYEEWEKLNMAEKQEAMYRAVVTEEGSDQIRLESKSIAYSVSKADEVTVSGDEYIVSGNKGTIDIKFNGEKDSEYYLLINDFHYDDGNTYYEDKTTDVTLNVRCEGQDETVEYHTNDYQFYNGKDDYAVYLGYHEEPISEISVEFEKAGTYTMKEVEVICTPMKSYPDDVKKMRETVLKDPVLSGNHLSGSIDCGHDTYLVLSVPYSKGWNAYVDGKKAEVLRVNECYMGLKLEKGSHQIEMRYHTPLLLAGAVISLIALIVLIACMVYKKKGRNEKVVSLL